MSAGQIVGLVVAVALAALAIWKRKRLGLEKTGGLLLVAVGAGRLGSGLLVGAARTPRR